MARIVIIGGTGYAGSNIVREASSRGHEVTAVSRHVPDEKTDAVTYRTCDVSDPDAVREMVAGADVVATALSPRGELEGRLREVMRTIAEEARAAGARLAVVGGAASLEVAPGGPRLVDTDGFPDWLKPEATEMAGLLEDLRGSDESLDWFFLSPAGGFGAFAPGERLGSFRLGGDVLLTDDEGNSFISGEDYAQAFVDEIERPAHRRQRFTVAY
ncbi:NAD(P)-dependent oxidoreductase [Tessaracoccus sp. Y36]